MEEEEDEEDAKRREAEEEGVARPEVDEEERGWRAFGARLLVAPF